MFCDTCHLFTIDHDSVHDALLFLLWNNKQQFCFCLIQNISHHRCYCDTSDSTTWGTTQRQQVPRFLNVKPKALLFTLAPRSREMKISPIVAPRNKVESVCFFFNHSSVMKCWCVFLAARCWAAASAVSTGGDHAGQRAEEWLRFRSWVDEPARAPRAARRFSGASTFSPDVTFMCWLSVP